MTSDSSTFWHPDQPDEVPRLIRTVPQLLTEEESEVFRETLQYFYSVYVNCADGVGEWKVERIRAIAIKHNIKLEDY